MEEKSLGHGLFLFVAPLGALMALLFPEPLFSGFSLFLPRIFGYYVTHAILVVCGLSLATLGFYRPDPKDIPRILKTFGLLAVGAHLINLLLRLTLCPEANYFFTYGAEIGVLKLFWRIIPAPLLYGLPAPLILAGYMYAVCALSRLTQRAEEVSFHRLDKFRSKKQEDKTLLDRNVRGIGIALCLLTLLLSLSGCGSLKDDSLLTVNAVITEVDTGKQTITVKDDADENTLGEECLIDCSSTPMVYCDFATQKVTRISFEELQVNDRVIVSIRSSEMESFRSGGNEENTLKVEQLQLYTQRPAE